MWANTSSSSYKYAPCSPRPRLDGKLEAPRRSRKVSCHSLRLRDVKRTRGFHRVLARRRSAALSNRSSKGRFRPHRRRHSAWGRRLLQFLQFECSIQKSPMPPYHMHMNARMHACVAQGPQGDAALLEVLPRSCCPGSPYRSLRRPDSLQAAKTRKRRRGKPGPCTRRTANASPLNRCRLGMFTSHMKPRATPARPSPPRSREDPPRSRANPPPPFPQKASPRMRCPAFRRHEAL